MTRLREIFRFEVWIQFRRRSTWLYLLVLLVLSFHMATQILLDGAKSGEMLFNAPINVAIVTLLGSLMGLLVAAAIAGDAATRDVQTRLAPLLYTTPVGKTSYLGGRFLAVFAMSSLLLLAPPIGHMVAAQLSGLEPALAGPFRADAYLATYALFALPNAFVTTALLFALAVLSRRAIASYLGAAFLFLLAMFGNQFIAQKLKLWELGKLMDPLGLTVVGEATRGWSPLAKNTLLIVPDGAVLPNRLLWIGIAVSALALTWLRTRFAHHAQGGGRVAMRPGDEAAIAPIVVPRVVRTFDFATRMRQMLAIARRSFRQVATSWGAIVLAAAAVLLTLSAPGMMQHNGIPLFPTTDVIATSVANTDDIFWMITPFLIVFYAGELVWRERDARLSDIADATPVPDWVPFAGKLAGLSLVLVALQALMMAAGIAGQALQDYYDFQVGLYVRILFGLQLADYLLFAVLAMVVQVLVNQKYVGYLVMAVAYGVTMFAPLLGIRHNLLVYASDPGWHYSDMSGFGPFLAPFMWFKLYWAGWALLLAILAKLLWVRGVERGLKGRVRLARRHFTRATGWTAAAAAGLVVLVGGFIFYNTDVLNAQPSARETQERHAEYERRYARYRRVPQPQLTGTSLRVELYPERREAAIRGVYRLENKGRVAIDAIHLAIAPEAETGPVTIDRPFALLVNDNEVGHRIYRLQKPLQPGEILRLSFEVRHAPRGFPDRDIPSAIVGNGTHFEQEWLPQIGYQPDRELSTVADRKEHGLTPRPEVPPLHDAEARQATSERIAFEAVLGTSANQVAVAPGTLRRTWNENGRRYFHYATDAPIRNGYALFSADYAVRDAKWNDVAIQVFHHPGHAWNVDRIIRGTQAALSYHTKEFGPYPYRQVRFVEAPGAGVSLRAHPINIRYFEGFALLNADDDSRNIDFPFAVAAHEVAHQWWGNQLSPAYVEGSPVLTESLAWYSAIGTVEEAHGREHLRRLLDAMREEYLNPRARADVPLLRATDGFVRYRKGPFAMYALREYVGEKNVNLALRRLLAKHGAGTPPRPTTLDLYAELQAVTPQSLRYLLADLFEVNTFWELEPAEVTAERAAGGTWRVTLDVTARKVGVDKIGTETERPMNDLIEIGVFAAPAANASKGELGAPLYLQKHRIRTGRQRITVTVPREPAHAGIDPLNLLIDAEWRDNTMEVKKK